MARGNRFTLESFDSDGNPVFSEEDLKELSRRLGTGRSRTAEEWAAQYQLLLKEYVQAIKELMIWRQRYVDIIAP